MKTPTKRLAKLTSLEIDSCLLHIIRDPELFAFARRHLKGNPFSPIGEMHYYTIWESVCAVAERNDGRLPDKAANVIQATDLSSRIQNSKDEISDVAARNIDELFTWIFSAEPKDLNSAYWKEAIKDLIVERNSLTTLNTLISQSEKAGRPADLPEQLRQLARDIRQVEADRKNESRTVQGDWPEYQRRLQTYRGRDLLGLKTGMRELDQRTLGLRGLFLLGAMPNVGKTALVLQLGINVVRSDPNVGFLMISLEMNRFDLYARLHCNLAEMDYRTLLRGNLEVRGPTPNPFTPRQQQLLSDADAWIDANGKRIRILDRDTFGADFAADDILSAIDTFKTEAGVSRVLVALDYLQLVPVPESIMRASDLEADKYRVRVVQDIVAGTKNEANPLGDAVLAISESRKPVSGRRAWGEEMADLMGSARLGYAADAVLLYRRMDDDEIENHYAGAGDGAVVVRERLEKQGIAPVILRLAKGRDGMRIGEWPLEYYFERSTFRELERTQDEADALRPRPRNEQPNLVGQPNLAFLGD